jgi:EcsC protein family
MTAATDLNSIGSSGPCRSVRSQAAGLRAVRSALGCPDKQHEPGPAYPETIINGHRPSGAAGDRPFRGEPRGLAAGRLGARRTELRGPVIGPGRTADRASRAGSAPGGLGHDLAGGQAALTRALRYALRTIPKEGRDPETRAHKALAALSGAMGGALGVSAVLVELPISTTIMLRSIARIAQTEGEDLQDPETALACLQVFALGGRTGSDNLHETGYFAVRAAMAKSVTRALQQMAGRGVVDESTSAIVRLLAQIGSRFGLVVSQKVAAQAIPVLGAIGGAAVNAAFVDHFQTLARGHFIVRRLERTYGKGTVRRAYNQIRVSEGL